MHRTNTHRTKPPFTASALEGDSDRFMYGYGKDRKWMNSDFFSILLWLLLLIPFIYLYLAGSGLLSGWVCFYTQIYELCFKVCNCNRTKWISAGNAVFVYHIQNEKKKIRINIYECVTHTVCVRIRETDRQRKNAVKTRKGIIKKNQMRTFFPQLCNRIFLFYFIYSFLPF